MMTEDSSTDVERRLEPRLGERNDYRPKRYPNTAATALAGNLVAALR